MPLDPSIALSVKPPAFNNPFEVLAQMQHLKAQQQVIQSNQALEESRRQDIAKQARTEEVQRKFYAIIAASKDPADAEARIKAEAPELYQPYVEQRQKLDKTAEEIASEKAKLKDFEANIAKKGQEYAEPFMQMVEKSGNDPKVFDFALGTIKGHFPDFPADQLRQQGGGDPAKIAQLIAGFKSPQQQNADTTAATASAQRPKLAAETQIAQAQAAGMSPEGLTPDQQRQQATRKLTASETARHNRAMEADARSRISQDDQAIALTPDALKLTAHQYAMTGQLPPMGMGKTGAATRTKIINEAAEIYKNLDMPSQVAAYQANRESLKKMQVQRDAVGAFEETAVKNLDQFLTAAKKVVDTKSPWLNRPMRTIAESGLGSSDQAAFNAARQAVIPEFAKLLGNPSLSGQLTDSQRKEIETILGPDATLAQIYASANILKQDAANRKQSLDDGIRTIQDRIAKPPSGATTTGTIRARDPQGKLHEAPAGTALPAGWKLER